MVRTITQLAPLGPHVSPTLVADTAYDVAASDRVIDGLRARAACLRLDIELASTRLANAEARVLATHEAHALLGRLVLEAQAAADHLVLTVQSCAPFGRTAPSPANEPAVIAKPDQSGDGGASFWWQILPARDPQTHDEMSLEPVVPTAPPPLSERVRVLRLAPPSGIPLAPAHERPFDPETRRHRRNRWFVRPFVRLFRRAA